MNARRGYLPLLVLGFFSLASQALLFRDVIASFGYSELGIAVFYATWLLWIAVGARAGRNDGLLGERLATRFPSAVLVYVPVFVLQHVLMTHARPLAGVPSYEAFPQALMLAWMFLLNAPVSLLTGWLFPLACRWAETRNPLPVARVYALETLGASAGGLFVTGLLAAHASSQVVFAWVCVAALAALLVPLGRHGKAYAAVYVLVLSGTLGGDVPGVLGNWWTGLEDRAAWSRLLPVDAYGGSVSTAHGRYLYGEREGQFLVMAGSGICESFPGGDHAAEVAALHIAQHPSAQEVLVFGPGSLGISGALCSLPGVTRVTWMHPDPEYPAAVSGLLQGWLPGKLELIPQDFGIFTRQGDRCFDLILLNLPEVTTLTVNRYCTVEFLASLKNILAPGGVVGVRISGGANYLGEELAELGATMVATLRNQFMNMVIKPGDETWLLASDGEGLSQSAAVLKERFAAVPGGPAMYPPEGLSLLYPEDRVHFQEEVYRRVLDSVPAADHINTEGAPKALRNGLFLLLKQAEWRAFSRVLRQVLGAGAWLFVLPILLYGVFRVVFLLKGAGTRESLFDSHFVIAATGFVSMAFNIVLLLVYQSRFGSLFVEIGLVTSLFMLGGSLGCVALNIALRRSEGPVLVRVMLACLTAQCLGLLAVAPLYDWSKPVWLALFVVGGVFTGAYFPGVARQAALRGIHVARTGANLETYDTLGGALGAFLTGLFLLPVLGAAGTVVLLAALIGVSALPLLLADRRIVHRGDWLDRSARPLGYTLAGVAVYVLVISKILSTVEAGQQRRSLEDMARTLTGVATLRKESAPRSGGSRRDYLVVSGEGECPLGYVLGSGAWAARVDGYGGPLQVLLYTDPQGVLLDYEMTRHAETPAYLRMVEKEKMGLLGRNLFDADPFAGVDAVSGATVTSLAVMRALETAGHGFAMEVLHKEFPASAGKAAVKAAQERDFIVLFLLTVAALVLHFRPSLWGRRIIVITSLVVGGIWLNLQFSMQQVTMLAGFQVGAAAWTGAFYLLVIVPVIVLLFGNVYCGYMCPFGALQELAGDILPGGRHLPDNKTWRYGRMVKYIFLFLLVLAYAGVRDGSVLRGDVLITVFSSFREGPVAALAVIVVALSFISNRFWCRNLCPAGAFLALCNGAVLLRRWMPVHYPGYCHLGVTTTAEMDCIRCDRCVVRKTEEKPLFWPRGSRAFNLLYILCVALVLIWACVLSVNATLTLFPETGSPATLGGGKPRDIQVEVFKRLIREDALSDHEADFYTRESLVTPQ